MKEHIDFWSFWRSGVFFARPGDQTAFPGAGTPTALDTDDLGTNDQIINISNRIPQFGNRNNLLLRYIMDDIAVENTVQETFSHLEDPANPVMVKFTGADESAQVSPLAGVTNWQRLVANNKIFWIRTKRITRVSATPTSATTVAIAGGLNFGSSGTPLLKNGDIGLVMVSNRPQGSTIGDQRDFGLVQYDFQTGIVDKAVRLTGTRAAQARRDGKNLFDVSLDNAMDRLNRELEVDAIFGRGVAPAVVSGDDHPTHASVGLDEWLSSIRYVFNRRPNRFDFEDAIQRLSRENDLESWPVITMVCSSAFKSMVSGWAVERMELPPGLKTFGMEIERIRTGIGWIIDLLPVTLLDKDPDLQGRAWIFNRRNMRYRPLIDDEDRDVRFYPDPTSHPGNKDFKAGRVLGEFGFEHFNKEGGIAFEGMEL